MPFCPNCKIEFTEETTKCTDCGAALVPWLSTPGQHGLPEADSIRPVELCEVADRVQQDLITTQLHEAGIPVVLRARNVAIFVQASRLEDAKRVLAGEKGAMSGGYDELPEAVGLSEMHRIRLTCSECDRVTIVDLLNERVPTQCPDCGHYFDLNAARPVLDRYADVMRMMANTDFDIELELPKAE